MNEQDIDEPTQGRLNGAVEQAIRFYEANTTIIPDALTIQKLLKIVNIHVSLERIEQGRRIALRRLVWGEDQ